MSATEQPPPLEQHHWVFVARLGAPLAPEAVGDLIPALVQAIAMTPIDALVVQEVSDGPERGELRALQLIAESHITLHTSGGRTVVIIDIFSCKVFAPAAAVDVLESALPADWWCKRIRRALTPPVWAEAPP